MDLDTLISDADPARTITIPVGDALAARRLHDRLVAKARRRQRYAVPATGVAAAGAVAAAVVLASPVGSPPTTANARHHHGSVATTEPVSFRTTESGNIVATVTDPFAAQSALNASFQAAGLNIVVTLEPVSPSLVGTVDSFSEPTNEPDGGIQPLGHGPCVTGGGGCSIGITVPRDFTGHGTITLGRPAKPGEAYVGTTSAFAPGEVLHCSGLINEQVAQALTTIQRDNITAYWGVPPHDAPPEIGATSGPQVPDMTPPPADDYIIDATPVAAGTVWFRASATPLPATDVQQEQPADSQDCPS
jgi:hypothetical protein